ncbi:MAG: MFS transporter, partial [Demequina sp.]
SFGGHTYAWASPQVIGLIAITVVAGVAFVFVERRAPEPVMPLTLFRRRNFVIPTAAGLLVGVGMFGTLGYMPTYLQMVAGVSATAAGLLMAPMMGAMLVTSIAAGRAVTRTGRYKTLPIVGSVFIAAGLYLLSTLSADGALWHVCAYLAVLGTGLGLSMQILVLVVQNTFPISMVGTATASNNYFRQIGASLGTAIVGALFTERLVRLLGDRLPAGGVGIEGGANSLTPALVQQLPEGLSDVIVGAYNDALTPVFLLMVPLALLSLLLLFFVKEVPLATRIEREVATDIPDAQAHSGAANREADLVPARPSS